MYTGTVIITNDLIGFYEGQSGVYTLIRDEKGKTRKVVIRDSLDDHVVSNPYALSRLYYEKLLARVAKAKE